MEPCEFSWEDLWYQEFPAFPPPRVTALAAHVCDRPRVMVGDAGRWRSIPAGH